MVNAAHPLEYPNLCLVRESVYNMKANSLSMLRHALRSGFNDKTHTVASKRKGVTLFNRALHREIATTCGAHRLGFTSTSAAMLAGGAGGVPGLPAALWAAKRSFSTDKASSSKVEAKMTDAERELMEVLRKAEDRVEPVDIQTEAEKSYLAYAMSVIVGRALPDARDGFKPVHRRILYAMYELGMSHNKPFRKCARVVGEVLGKYHPHGDQAVYDSMVRMAQDFSLRQPLINGHGNFGSLDNDPPAAMRYTECKLLPISELSLFADVGPHTTDFTATFDGSRTEPAVLPSALPMLFLNGSTGIAVGMATNIPPHNLGELVEALCAAVDHPEASVAELMQHLPAPDFPTGGELVDQNNELSKIYNSGSGSLTLRGKAEIESMPSGRQGIVILEVPYAANKAALVEQIAELVNSRTLEGVSDIRDESDRDGVRVVVEVKRGSDANVVLNNLYKHSKLSTRFHCNMTALVAGRPVTLTLTSYLQEFIRFRKEVIVRRSEHQLRKAEERAHLVQGLLLALTNMEQVIDIIRQAQDGAEASGALQGQLGMSGEQAKAVLEMPLRRLTGLERGKLEGEAAELAALLEDLRDLLNTPARVAAVLKKEARHLAAKFGDERRTVVLRDAGSVAEVEMVPNNESVVILSTNGYLKRVKASVFGTQNRKTRGKAGSKLKENDTLSKMVQCRDRDTILFFSERGAVFAAPAYRIPESTRTAGGAKISQMTGVPPGEQVQAMMVLPYGAKGDLADTALLMVTKQGYIKKTLLAAFANIRPSGLAAITLTAGDRLKWVQRATAADAVFIALRSGLSIMFRTDDDAVRSTGRQARGVRAVKVAEGDSVTAMDILPTVDQYLSDDAPTDDEVEESDDAVRPKQQGPWALVASAKGKLKRVPMSAFKLQRRGGKGVIAGKFAQGDCLVGMRIVGVRPEEDVAEVLMASEKGMVNKCRVDDIPSQGRTAQGVQGFKMKEDDRLRHIQIVVPDLDPLYSSDE